MSLAKERVRKNNDYQHLKERRQAWAELGQATDWQDSRSRLGLETKSTETLGLVKIFGGCLVSVSSQMKNLQTVSSRSRLASFNFT